MGGSMKLLSAIVVAAVVIAAVAQAQVAIQLTPCLPYVTGEGPIGECCDGLRALERDADTKAERQSVCSCVKSLAPSYPDVDYDLVADLPSQCGVDVPYILNPAIDCSQVQ